MAPILFLSVFSSDYKFLSQFGHATFIDFARFFYQAKNFRTFDEL